MNESIKPDQEDIRVGSKYLSLMIRVLWPIFLLIGIIGVPYFSDIEPYWKIPTVIPASISIFLSLVSYILLKRNRYYLAVNLYVYMFIFLPIIAAANSSASSPGLLPLSLGGVIIATVLFRKRSAVVVCAIITMVTPVSLIFLFPDANQLPIFISISAVVCISVLVLVFKSINDTFENNRRNKLEEFNVTLLEQNKKLTKINNELDKFIYSVSHDMRGPLASVKGLVSLYKSESKPENKDTYVNHIESSISKLDNYTFDIVDFAKNSRTEIVPVRINVKEYLNSIYSQLDHLHPMKEISCEVCSDTTIEIITDRERLGIILRNIVGNSIKYSKRSADSYIKCEIEQVNEKNIIRIIDNGIGIKESQLDKIFDMFYRGSETSNGSGLGLYIAREAAEVLGGSIMVSSAVMGNTTFTIELPNLPVRE